LHFNHRPEGFVLLSKDPRNPFIQLSTFHARAYICSLTDHFSIEAMIIQAIFQVGSAFEIYSTAGNTHGRLAPSIVDTTSFKSGIAAVANKRWTYADCSIIFMTMQAAKF
jgi:hypothetical protein